MRKKKKKGFFVFFDGEAVKKDKEHFHLLASGCPKPSLHTSLMRMGDGVSLPHGWDRPLISHANAMAAWIGEAWRGDAKLDAIVLGGSGAELDIVVDRVRRLFRDLRVVQRPQIAVALGCARYARSLAATPRAVQP